MSGPAGGTSYSSVTVSGAWRQKDIGSSKIFYRRTRQTTPGTPYETAWTIAGSNDTITWYLVDRVSGQDTSAGVDGYNGYRNSTYYLGDYSYQYYRYIVEEMSGPTTSIMNGVFGWYDAYNDILTESDTFSWSQDSGDLISPYSLSFYVRGDPNDVSYQTTTRYNTTGSYTGNTTTLIYDPYSPTTASAPTNLVQIPGSTNSRFFISVSFTPPVSDGGSAINKYYYAFGDDIGGNNFSNFFNANGNTATIDVRNSGLGEGSADYFAIKAGTVNGGIGPVSNITYVRTAIPGPPTITSVTPGSGFVTVLFSSPIINPRPTTNYQYSSDGGLTYTVRNPASTSPSLTISSLVNGQTYQIVLKAINQWGDGFPSNTVSATPQAIAPSAPTGLTVSIGNMSFTISFTPGSDGGDTITNYKYSTDNGTTYTAFSPPDTESPVTITTIASGQPLTVGQSYQIKLLAVNSIGDGTASVTISATAATIPDAPTITSISFEYFESQGRVSLNAIPGSNRGSTITNYKYSIDNGVSYITPLFVSDYSTSVTIPMYYLSKGQTYQIKLRAVNSVGDGIESSTTTLIMPIGIPAAPTINSITVGNKTATVTFTAPSSDGGSAITDYQYSTNGSTYISAGTTSPFTISGLLNGQTYPITLRAVNSAGNGTASNAVNAVLPALAPDAPTALSVTVGNKTATITFTPGSNNGAAITKYQYSTDSGTSYTDASGTTSPITVSLLNGQTYQIILRAVNSVGDGAASSAVTAVLPALAPDAPTGLTVTRGNTSITINFTPGSNNGAAIRKYKYSINNGASYQDVDLVTTTSPVTISGLTNGQSYTILLKAVNDIGESDASSASPSVIPSTTPAAPSINSVTRGNNSLVVDFTPGSNGGDAIVNYKYSINGTTYYAFDPVVTTSPATISLVNGTSLTNGQTYNVTLLAVNTNGDGLVSASLSGTPSSVPDAPTGLTATVGNTTVTISFTPGFDQGSAILNYKYSTNGTDYYEFNPAVTASPVTISGLVNNQSYNITLLAVNANGDGVVSAIVVATPTAVAPNPPTGLTRSYAGSGSVSIYFTAGSDGGTPITNYEYSINGGITYVALNPPDTTSPITISGLTNGQSYTIQLRAASLAGPSIESSTITFTPTATFTQNHVCFLEGSMITCYDPESSQEVERPVQSLRKGDLVKTTMDGYKTVHVIGTSKIYNPPNSMRSMHRLYRCPKENYPDLNEDLVLTGCHAILVSELSEEERSDLLLLQGKIYTTEDYYRLIACCDKRTIPYEKDGFFNIWHLALENENSHFNYGIYANGLKVETASINTMKERSGMTLM